MNRYKVVSYVRILSFKKGVRLIILLLFFGWIFSGWPQIGGFPTIIEQAHASISITTATGGDAISADTTGVSYTTLSGPTITESTHGDIKSSGTIVLSAPTGFVFNTGATVTATITSDAGSGICFKFSATSATPLASTITFTATAVDSKNNTYCHVTFSNIQVRPSAGTPLASGDITNTGTNTGVSSGTIFGTLTEIAGAKNKLIITTQPSTSANAGVDFTTKPVVTLQDQFGNTVTSDSASTITETVVLSSQSCGGTAGSGSLTSTPSSGSAVTNGVMTYTAMQYSIGEAIKICFSSSGVSSALSNTVTVANVIISIILTSSGTISYGYVAPGMSSSTISANIQTIKNDGTGSEELDIKGQNTACPWTLSSTIGTDQYKHEFSTTTGSTWIPLTTSYQTMATGITANGTQSFDLQITVPSTTSCFSQQSVDVTIMAISG